ncbi:MAG: beta-ketoacyl-[acyl-carrier-protein] synthase family protein [Candidatus Omnitrophica bacterium]|nr:beta-ketoacyl-[acyl-carrier-protein] synthase family protein [Candidatus Omnitrophota bacterium]
MANISPNLDRRVVVTGLGVVSSLGIGWQEFWKNLLAGKSGISKIESFDTSEYDRHYGGEVKNFDPSKFISKHKIFQIGRASQMAVAASKLAIEDAGLTLSNVTCDRFGVFIGTTTGEIALLEKYYEEERNRSSGRHPIADFLVFPSNSLSINIAKDLNLKSDNVVFANACAAGNYAMGRAFDLIKSGQIDYALAGGVDGLSQVVFTGFTRLLAIATEKCQPFDKNRKGMIPGEGAGILVLESFESAQKRKARIYAEILGCGLSCDAFHMTSPSADGITKALNKALEISCVPAKDVDYISAHGTGTVENDEEECLAFKNIFKDKLKRIPISSIKSMLGHTMGAASAIEAIACCLIIKDQVIPPTINFETKDPDCDIDCVPNQSRKSKVNIVLNNSQAFGGNNAVLVLARQGLYNARK